MQEKLYKGYTKGMVGNNKISGLLILVTWLWFLVAISWALYTSQIQFSAVSTVIGSVLGAMGYHVVVYRNGTNGNGGNGNGGH